MAREKTVGENGEEQIRVKTESAKCPGCGSNLVFNPDEQLLFCEHCGTTKTIDKNPNIGEIPLERGITGDNIVSGETTVFRCDNCGAKVVLQGSETAKSCPFCGTAHVTKVDELTGLKPNSVLPFLFGKEKASEYSKKWARRRFFAPHSFKKTLNAENINGVYSPCFTFDSNTVSVYEGKIGTTHTRTVGSGKNAHTETYTVWRYISGTYDSAFDDILIDAGVKIGQKNTDKLSPYDTNNGTGFKEDYLLGFMAYHYERSIDDCWQSARDKMDAMIRKGILSQYSYDKIAYLNVSTTHNNVTYKYVLIPVYVGHFNFKKKLFNFFVNGTTGKVAGKTPVSFWRVLSVVLAGLAVVAAIVYLVVTS